MEEEEELERVLGGGGERERGSIEQRERGYNKDRERERGLEVCGFGFHGGISL